MLNPEGAGGGASSPRFTGCFLVLLVSAEGFKKSSKTLKPIPSKKIQVELFPDFNLLNSISCRLGIFRFFSFKEELLLTLVTS